jgi:hypothetical protein
MIYIEPPDSGLDSSGLYATFQLSEYNVVILAPSRRTLLRGVRFAARD